MSITKTIGGDRIGSGKKMKATLHGYSRSNHNLSRKVTTAMSCGTLVPIYCKPALNGDKWQINLNALVKTIPTVGPLFGSFKFQVDFYKVPIRLYQGILHNNPINLGLNMNKVYLPKLILQSKNTEVRDEFGQVAANALVKYLGISGIGIKSASTPNIPYVQRKFNAIPTLAYYDIFKNYYANKQETNAYILTANPQQTSAQITGVAMINSVGDYVELGQTEENEYTAATPSFTSKIFIYGEGLDANYITINSQNLVQLVDNAICYLEKETKEEIIVVVTKMTALEKLSTVAMTDRNYMASDITIEPFPLENIDEMRNRLLSSNTLGTEYTIGPDYDLAPYNFITKVTGNDRTPYNSFSQNGLCLKTYQSDMFNNWLKTEYIDGENGINAITAIDTSSGSFTLDALNLSQKIYNMLNRIAISGGTYEDWQEAVYDEQTIRKAETPMYIGGMSSEIAFEEVVSTSETMVNNETTKLGTLAGKGTLLGKRAGYIEVKIEEPSFIIGIASITPRISYYQGNEWFNTELDTLDDLHKPELDGIGYQDLITERMAWWDARIKQGSGNSFLVERRSAGKLPAWMEYMTDVDVVFSDFADNSKSGFMVLKRDYLGTFTSSSNILDLTTYIDPTKYNTAFAYQKLDAQNFWVQINVDIKNRRKMSARIIPNM